MSGTQLRKPAETVSDKEIEMDYTIEVEQEADGRWLAEVPELPGVLAYGATVDQAQSRGARQIFLAG